MRFQVLFNLGFAEPDLVVEPKVRDLFVLHHSVNHLLADTQNGSYLGDGDQLGVFRDCVVSIN